MSNPTYNDPNEPSTSLFYLLPSKATGALGNAIAIGIFVEEMTWEVRDFSLTWACMAMAMAALILCLGWHRTCLGQRSGGASPPKVRHMKATLGSQIEHEDLNTTEKCAWAG